MHRMNDEDTKELSLKRYNNLRELSLRITDDYNEARRQDVSQLRSVIGQISVLSFGIVGFSATIITNANLIQNFCFFYLGLTIITISAIASLWYLAIQTENSLIKALKGYRKNKEEVSSAMEI